jgi:hypothetical protein
MHQSYERYRLQRFVPSSGRDWWSMSVSFHWCGDAICAASHVSGLDTFRGAVRVIDSHTGKTVITYVRGCRIFKESK